MDSVYHTFFLLAIFPVLKSHMVHSALPHARFSVHCIRIIMDGTQDEARGDQNRGTRLSTRSLGFNEDINFEWGYWDAIYIIHLTHWLRQTSTP